MVEKSYYVNMTDKFMSGWGKARNGKSHLSIHCDTWYQAKCIFDAAKKCKEMKYVMHSEKPRYRTYPKQRDHTSVWAFSQLGGHWLANYSPELDIELGEQNEIF